jgi:hypothetical protein
MENHKLGIKPRPFPGGLHGPGQGDIHQGTPDAGLRVSFRESPFSSRSKPQKPDNPDNVDEAEKAQGNNLNLILQDVQKITHAFTYQGG